MGKASMCIRMLQILNTGRVYKISELAGFLETNPRNIIEYKKELDEVASECGFQFYIETIPGRYGGYCLNGQAVIPPLSLLPEEKESLNEALKYLLARNDFLIKNDYQSAMGKIFTALVNKSIDREELLVINRFPLVMSEEELKIRSDTIKTAINEKKQIVFTYLSNKNVLKEHTFAPYELFMYNNSWFVIGWLYSETHNDICWFKLNRIKSIRITNKKFTVWKYFHKTDYVDEFGFKTNGEWYHLEFIAYGPYASLCKERIYGKNQVVTPIDENSTRVSVDMQNLENIIAFLMGFSKYIKIIEPQEIKQEILNRIEELKENCKL